LEYCFVVRVINKKRAERIYNHTFDSIGEIEGNLSMALKEISTENAKMRSLCHFIWGFPENGE